MKTRQQLRKGLILFSFFLFPATFYYLSPVLILEASAKGIINGSFIFFVLLFISSLFLGRSYCGWACPAAGCQEALFQVRDTSVRKGNIIKWLIWVPWIAAIAILAARAGGYREVDFLYQTTYGLSIGNVQSLIAYFIVLIVLIVLPALLVGKRSFCHHLCWMAPFIIIGRKLRNNFHWQSLQLTAEPQSCKHCHTCTDSCPMSLPVEQMVHKNTMESPECILCGTCVDGCQERVIRFTFKRF